MFWSGFISGEQLGKALAEKVRIRKKEEKTFSRAPYFTEHVRRYLIQTYGRARVYRQGLTVYTTVNLRMQEAARKALQKGLYELDKREGYRGPLRRLPPGQIPGFIEAAAKRQALHEPAMGSIVEGVVIRVDDKKGEAAVCIGSRMGRLPLSRMRWARRPNAQVSYPGNRVRRPSQVLSKGDVIQLRLIKGARTPFAWEVSLEQTPLVQGALFCMDPGTGEVKAMVGGRDYDQSQFNRAVQSRRQPGSAFKPIIYAAALDSGMTPGTVLLDAPFVCEQGPHMKPWKPENYTKEYLGPIILRNALAKSKNVVTVKLLKRIGVPHAVRYARNLGIQSPLSPYLALALGCSGVSLMELTRAYSVFCNQGVLVRPIFIKRIVDRDGRVLEENRPVTRRAISKETAYLITDLLRTVIREGTGRRVRAFKRPAAGKTGTTNNLWDAWFVGYTPDLATGVWVGYDDRRPMGKRETGSKAASPIWLAFMSSVFKGLPVTDFQVPKGMVYAKIDTKTGLLADSDTEASVIQVFKKGSEPKFTSAEADEDTLLSSRFLQFDLGNSQ
jgi:penicillin-binding protein 1A